MEEWWLLTRWDIDKPELKKIAAKVADGGRKKLIEEDITTVQYELD